MSAAPQVATRRARRRSRCRRLPQVPTSKGRPRRCRVRHRPRCLPPAHPPSCHRLPGHLHPPGRPHHSLGPPPVAGAAPPPPRGLEPAPAPAELPFGAPPPAVMPPGAMAAAARPPLPGREPPPSPPPPVAELPPPPDDAPDSRVALHSVVGRRGEACRVAPSEQRRRDLHRSRRRRHRRVSASRSFGRPASRSSGAASLFFCPRHVTELALVSV